MNTIRAGFIVIAMMAATYGLVALLLLGRADAVAAAVVFVVALLGWWATHRSGKHRQAGELKVLPPAGTSRREINFTITVDPDRAPPWMKYQDEPFTTVTECSLLTKPANWAVIQGGKTRR